MRLFAACACLATVLITGCASSTARGTSEASPGGTTSTADLRKVASDWADDMKVRVLDIQSVRTTDTKAYRVLTGKVPDAADVSGDAYWLVQVHAVGAFDCECSFRGPGPP